MSNENIKIPPQNILPKIEELLSVMEARKELQRQLWEKDRRIWELTKMMRKFLSPRDYDIFKARNVDKVTLDAIGKQYGVTRERVRQLDDNIKRRLIRIVYQ